MSDLKKGPRSTDSRSTDNRLKGPEDAIAGARGLQRQLNKVVAPFKDLEKPLASVVGPSGVPGYSGIKTLGARLASGIGHVGTALFAAQLVVDALGELGRAIWRAEDTLIAEGRAAAIAVSLAGVSPDVLVSYHPLPSQEALFQRGVQEGKRYIAQQKKNPTVEDAFVSTYLGLVGKESEKVARSRWRYISQATFKSLQRSGR